MTLRFFSSQLKRAYNLWRLARILTARTISVFAGMTSGGISYEQNSEMKNNLEKKKGEGRVGEKRRRLLSWKPILSNLREALWEINQIHLHRIYKELNMAWNSRDDKTFVTDIRAIGRRGLFLSIFATGSHNLWRK
jgi:hypothetical protein